MPVAALTTVPCKMKAAGSPTLWPWAASFAVILTRLLLSAAAEVTAVNSPFSNSLRALQRHVAPCHNGLFRYHTPWRLGARPRASMLARGPPSPPRGLSPGARPGARAPHSWPLRGRGQPRATGRLLNAQPGSDTLGATHVSLVGAGHGPRGASAGCLPGSGQADCAPPSAVTLAAAAARTLRDAKTPGLYDDGFPSDGCPRSSLPAGGLHPQTISALRVGARRTGASGGKSPPNPGHPEACPILGRARESTWREVPRESYAPVCAWGAAQPDLRVTAMAAWGRGAVPSLIRS